MSMPHVFASQIAYISQHLKYRDNVVLSVHPHNDRGTGVADAEMAILPAPTALKELCLAMANERAMPIS